MASMTGPADTLHRAAALLRQRAVGGTPGPWEVDAAGTHEVSVRRANATWEQVACYTGYAAHDKDAARVDADYIAIVHPGVGLLLADLLDRAAQRAEVVYETAIDEIAVEPHLAVARAILGTDQDAGRPA
jgi:hypothetical protein